MNFCLALTCIHALTFSFRFFLRSTSPVCISFHRRPYLAKELPHPILSRTLHAPFTHPSRTLQKQTKTRRRRDSNAGLSEISSGDRPCIQVDFANLPFAKGNLKSYFVSVVPLDYASCYVILIEDL
jgi:hypothetical protein